MTQENPYQAPSAALTEFATGPAPADAQAEPIGGWLYLIGFAVVLAPFMMLTELRGLFAPILENGAWAHLTTPGSKDYHPFSGALIVSEATINLVLLASWVYMNYLFFSKKKAFPKWYIRTQLGTLAFLVFDTLATQVVMPELPLLDAETNKELARAAVAVCVWVPYMLVSNRVERTFVRS